jgi:glycosyltransferase involved in cell wall biosynthesis
MKIALLANAASVHTVRWANALSERGLQIELLSLEQASQELSPDVTCHQLRFSRPLGYFLAASEARRLLQQLRPNLLHAHYASGYGTLARLCRFRPTILSVWGSDIYCFPRKSPLHRRLIRQNVRHADRVFSTSKAMAEETSRLCGPLDNLSITPFGIDTELFRPSNSPRSTDDIVIGTVKILRSVYGIDTLLRGFARCRQQLALAGKAALANRLRLKIVGDGPERAALERLATELGVTSATTFVPAVPHCQVPEMLHQLDVYVAVSRSESFGVAVLEASAAGLPVIVSHVGGLPEVVQDRQTGMIVPPNNPGALALELTRLVEDSTLRQQLGERGRHHVQGNYRWDDSVSQVIDLYQDIVNQQISETRCAA